MLETIKKILGLARKEPASFSDLIKPADEDWFEYKFKTELRGQEYETVIGSTFPIRNHETLLREHDIIFLCEKGHVLMNQTVSFALNGGGRMISRPVLYCPTCDSTPPESAPLFASLNNQLIFV